MCRLTRGGGVRIIYLARCSQLRGTTVAGGANKDFLADPEDFLNDNVIMVSEGLLPVGAGAHTVNLILQTADEVEDANHVLLPVFKPRLATPGSPGRSSSWFSHQFTAFYLPWQPDQHFVIDLDNRADYLFTPGLTGCTFAAIGGAQPKVGHFNYLRPNTDTVSRTRTRQAVTNEFGADRPDAYLKKSMYPTPGNAVQRYVFIVGFRTGGQHWRFLAQYLDYVGPARHGGGRLFERRTAPAPVHNGAHI